MGRKTKRFGKGILLLGVLVGIIATAFFTADYLQNSPAAQTFIAQFGYAGVIILAIVAGLNVIIPVPAASFVPIFTASGLWLPGIILALTVGTLIADYIGFLFGKWSRAAVTDKYPKAMMRFEKLYTSHYRLIPFIIFLYAAFMPFPNEAMILPLAVLGAKFRQMILPLFLGNLINQTIFSYGIQNVFLWLF